MAPTVMRLIFGTQQVLSTETALDPADENTKLSMGSNRLFEGKRQDLYGKALHFTLGKHEVHMKH